MAKAKARKKARNSKAPPARIDSTAGVVMSAADGRQSLESLRPSLLESIPPGDADADADANEGDGESEAGDSVAPPPVVAKASERESVVPDTELAPTEPAPELKKVSAEEPKKGPALKAHAAESGEFHTHDFFAKSEEEIHDDHARAEAPDLHDDDHIGAPPRRHVHQRAKHFVIGVVGVFAAIGIAGAVMRKASPRAEAASSVVQPQPEAPVSGPTVIAVPPPPAPAAIQAPPAPAVIEPASVAPAASSAADPSASAASVAPAASAAPAPSAAPSVAASVVASAGPTAPAAPTADEDDALTGGQLLSKARQAIGAGAASKAAAYAKKAIAKGAGGSAYYVLGAAYQTMGANGAAKSAYSNCAKTGCAEAGECASLVEGM